MKTCSVGAELFRVDGQTEGRTDTQTNMTNLILAFCKYANARINYSNWRHFVLFHGTIKLPQQKLHTLQIATQTRVILLSLPPHKAAHRLQGIRTMRVSVLPWYNIRRVQPTRCNVSQFIYFCKTLYMFQTGFPPIIRISKLHIQHQVFVRPLLLTAASRQASSS